MVDTPQFWIEQWHLLTQAATAYGGYGTAATWNAMAAGYGASARGGEKRDRAERTAAVLEARGVALEGARVLDIGCGPGEYAATFARQGAEVVCVDVAERMIERLERDTAPAERARITPVVAGWESLDLCARGFAGAFDLVFANMTPGVSGPEACLKIIEASRGWCWFQGGAGPRENPLLERLHAAVFGSPAAPFRGNFLCAYNLACACGYFPDCTFESMLWTRRRSVDACIDHYMTFFGSRSTLPFDTLRHTIASCLSEVAVDGMVENTAKGHTGRMLWNVEDRSVRDAAEHMRRTAYHEACSRESGETRWMNEQSVGRRTESRPSDK